MDVREKIESKKLFFFVAHLLDDTPGIDDKCWGKIDGICRFCGGKWGIRCRGVPVFKRIALELTATNIFVYSDCWNDNMKLDTFRNILRTFSDLGNFSGRHLVWWLQRVP